MYNFKKKDLINIKKDMEKDQIGRLMIWTNQKREGIIFLYCGQNVLNNQT